VKAGARPRQRVLDDHQRHKYNLTHSRVANPMHARRSETWSLARRCDASSNDANAQTRVQHRLECARRECVAQIERRGFSIGAYGRIRELTASYRIRPANDRFGSCALLDSHRRAARQSRGSHIGRSVRCSDHAFQVLVRSSCSVSRCRAGAGVLRLFSAELRHQHGAGIRESRLQRFGAREWRRDGTRRLHAGVAGV
jgi:hypothetical protein